MLQRLFSFYLLLVFIGLTFISLTPVYATQANEKGKILFYFAYGTPDAITLEGRIYRIKNQVEAKESDSVKQNIKRNLKYFIAEEYKKYPFQVQLNGTTWQLETDAEGYFQTRIIPPDGLTYGWHTVTAQGTTATGHGKLLIASPHNPVGIISDLDDTIMISDVLRKHTLLENTLLKNPQQRQAVPGVAALYNTLTQRNPTPESTALFYLSASPRQLHDNITDFLRLNHFPKGVLITRKIGLDGTSDPLIDTFTYKTEKISQILDLIPETKFILAGDDGEKDPEIYNWIWQRYPDRIEAIWIRRVHPDPQRQRFPNQVDLEMLIKTAFSSTAQ